MALDIEPYAARLCFTMPVAIDGAQWQRMLATFMETVAGDCIQCGAKLIGHIKGLATFSNHAFLKISIIDPGIPADIYGQPPEASNETLLNINVLVYGLGREKIHQIVQDIINQSEKPWKGYVSLPLPG